VNLYVAAICDQGLATIPVCGSFVDVTEMGDCVGIEQRLLLFGLAVISSHSNADQDWAILRVVSCDSSYDGQLLFSVHALQGPVDGQRVPGPTVINVPALSDNFHVRPSVPDGSDVRIGTLCVPALAASPACLEASLLAFVATFLSRSSCGFAGGRFVIYVIASLPCIVIGIQEQVSSSCLVMRIHPKRHNQSSILQTELQCQQESSVLPRQPQHVPTVATVDSILLVG